MEGERRGKGERGGDQGTESEMVLLGEQEDGARRMSEERMMHMGIMNGLDKRCGGECNH